MSSALAFSASVAARPASVAARRAASSRRARVAPRGGGPRARPRSAAVSTEDIYEVTLPKPIGVKFARGNGGAYVTWARPSPSMTSSRSAIKSRRLRSFGEIWDADSYGQVVYAMKNRNGDIYLKMRKMNGDLSALEQNEKSSAMAAERAGGNYGAGTKEQQMQNFSKKKELEVQRLDMFDEGIALYNKEDFDGALIVFEEVAALEPKNYMSDSFEMATEIYRVSEYNIACCFANWGRRELSGGVEKVHGARLDRLQEDPHRPSLANVQKADGFKEMMDKFTTAHQRQLRQVPQGHLRGQQGRRRRRGQNSLS